MNKEEAWIKHANEQKLDLHEYVPGDYLSVETERARFDYDAGFKARDEKVCEWKKITGSIAYTPGCFEDGIIKYSWHKYCGHCGGKIKEIRRSIARILTAERERSKPGEEKA